MFKYLIDTANLEEIDFVLNKLEKVAGAKEAFQGITTNPNAMKKIGLTRLEEWVNLLPILCKRVSDFRGDNKGLVHVQLPNSKMTGGEATAYAKYISGFSDGQTKLALKIPPTQDVLTCIDQIKEYMLVNVTGLADWGIASYAGFHRADFVSLIPGRMEERGIDASRHLVSAFGIDYTVITGSMRTARGVIRALEASTLPTIGFKVWKLLFEEGYDFNKEVENKLCLALMDDPEITRESFYLSKEFFEQMDECSPVVHEDFLNL